MKSSKKALLCMSALGVLTLSACAPLKISGKTYKYESYLMKFSSDATEEEKADAELKRTITDSFLKETQMQFLSSVCKIVIGNETVEEYSYTYKFFGGKLTMQKVGDTTQKEQEYKVDGKVITFTDVSESGHVTSTLTYTQL